MHFSSLSNNIESISIWIPAIVSFIFAAIIVVIAVPLINYASMIRGFYAIPNGRTSHSKPTPFLGGVGVFGGFILTFLTIAGPFCNTESIYFIAGLIILFFVGVKDDITISHAKTKLIGQLLVSVYISVFADIRITYLYDIFGLNDISYLVSILFTIFVLIALINSFNLIDGIDGLATGIGIVASLFLGLWFLTNENIVYTVMSLSLTGSLVAFFYFNVFSKKHKMFLGNTGSNITGLILGVLVIRFLQIAPDDNGYIIKTPPAIAVSLFIIPLFDAIRVSLIRIFQGRSPFTADRQHLHHRLIGFGFSHLQATGIIVSVNTLLIIISYLLRDLGNYISISLLFIICILLTLLTLYLEKKKFRNDYGKSSKSEHS